MSVTRIAFCKRIKHAATVVLSYLSLVHFWGRQIERERMASLQSTCDLQQLLSTPAVATSNQTYLEQSSSICCTPCDRPSLCVMQGQADIAYSSAGAVLSWLQQAPCSVDRTLLLQYVQGSVQLL